MRRLNLCHMLCVAALISFSHPAFAEIYKWVDADGKTHYSQTPPQDQDAKDIGDEIALSAGRASTTSAQSTPEQAKDPQKDNPANVTSEDLKKARKKGKKKQQQHSAQCQHNIKLLKKMLENPVIRWQDKEKGEDRILGTKERKEKIGELKKAIDTYCVSMTLPESGLNAGR